MCVGGVTPGNGAAAAMLNTGQGCGPERLVATNHVSSPPEDAAELNANR